MSDLNMDLEAVAMDFGRALQDRIRDSLQIAIEEATEELYGLYREVDELRGRIEALETDN